MADNDPALRAELNAALDFLAPQLRGLEDLGADFLSGDLLAVIHAQIINRLRRRALIVAVLNALDAVNAALALLVADGYPALPPVPIAPSLIQEMQAEISDVAAATSIFTPAPAEQGDFNPGSAVIA